MNVYKRGKSGVYWYRFEYKGHQIRRSSGVKNKQDAMDIASAYRTQLAKGEVGIKEPEPAKPIPRFDAAMATFLDWSEQEYAAHPATHRRYLTSSKALIRAFGTKPLDNVRKEDVEAFKTARAKERKRPAGRATKRSSKGTIKPATVNRELALLGHLFNHFYDLLDGRNPCRKVKKLAENNTQDRVLNREEEKLYLMAASQPLRDISTLMLETGMRPEEVYRIARSNVYLEQGYLFNPYGKTKAARRKVWLNETAYSVVARRLEQGKGDYLFPGRVNDRPIVKVNAAHTSAVKRSGIAKCTLYSLRHTWATRAAQSGVDLVTLAAMLGHSKINMVLRYAHPGEQHQADAMRKIQASAAR